MNFGLAVLCAAVVTVLGLGGGARGGSAGRSVARRSAPSSGPARDPDAAVAAASLLAGTAYDGELGARATLLQFSSAFCAPCRATRRVLADVADLVPGVRHVEIDAEHHLELVRRLDVLRTPTTLVLDARGREVTRAYGVPARQSVLASLGPLA